MIGAPGDEGAPIVHHVEEDLRPPDPEQKRKNEHPREPPGAEHWTRTRAFPSFERSTVEVKGEWLIAGRDEFYELSERFGSRLLYFLKAGCT